MTIQVYKIRNGEIIEDSGPRVVEPIKHFEMTTAYPPCECPQHRPVSAEVRR
ncbi:hypothetical protein AB0E62_00495 [Streptomyces sp. NPDC038707]|uniref:hypothetical protein n=1 Tax=Streptomyces sp. NPDC038707 TaxID=3154329 RepID=UPI0033E59E65